VNLGYGIEFMVMMVLTSFCFGILARNKRVFYYDDLLVIPMCTILGTVISTFILNGMLVLGTLVFFIISAIGCMIGAWFLGTKMKNPMKMYREYRASKEAKVKKQLKDTMDEIARLRSSDPELHKALKSLDAMTTALYD
jgi:hypothetical protein